MRIDRIDFDFVLEVVAPLTLGTGRLDTKPGAEEASIAAIHMDVLGEGGRPCIPASSLKGALRARWSGAPADAGEVFGLINRDTDTGQSGRLLLWAARVASSSSSRKETKADAEGDTFDRPSTAIDRDSGAAARGKLFSQRAVKRGTRFRLRGAFLGDYGAGTDWRDRRDKDLTLLANALAPLQELALGRGSRLGYGRISLVKDGSRLTSRYCDPQAGYGVEDLTKAFFDALGAAGASGGAICEARLKLTATTPFIIVNPAGLSAKADEGETRVNIAPMKTADGEPLLWPSSLIGALRAKAAWIAEIDRLRQRYAKKEPRFVPQDRAEAVPADDRFLEKVFKDRRAVADEADLAKLTSVERLFGVPGWKGMIQVTIPHCTNAGVERKLTGVSIDRLSGGARDGALFTFETRQNCVFDVTLGVALDRRSLACELLARDKELFAELLATIQKEGLMLGHGAARGFGWFEVKRT